MTSATYGVNFGIIRNRGKKGKHGDSDENIAEIRLLNNIKALSGTVEEASATKHH